MCFRPPNVKKPIKCPACSTLNPGENKNCKKCGAELAAQSEK